MTMEKERKALTRMVEDAYRKLHSQEVIYFVVCVITQVVLLLVASNKP